MQNDAYANLKKLREPDDLPPARSSWRTNELAPMVVCLLVTCLTGGAVFVLQSQSWVLGNPRGIIFSGSALETALPHLGASESMARAYYYLILLCGTAWLAINATIAFRHLGRGGRIDRDDRRRTLRGTLYFVGLASFVFLVLTTFYLATARYAVAEDGVFIKETPLSPLRIYRWGDARRLSIICHIEYGRRGDKTEATQISLGMADGRAIYLDREMLGFEWSPEAAALFGRLRGRPIVTSVSNEGPECTAPALPAFLPPPTAPRD
jgi:hypothetical protein